MTSQAKPRRAVVCAPLMPEFDREGGSRRVFHLIQFLREAGCAVSFVAENPYGDERYARMLQQSGVSVYRGFGPQTAELFRLGRFDIAIFAFWHLAEKHIPSLRRLAPEMKIVVDAIDLHWLRNAREYFLRATPRVAAARRNPGFHAFEMVKELDTYIQADAVLTVSEKEAEVIDDLLGSRACAYTVPDHEESIASGVPLEDRKGILFVGNFKHAPNADSVSFFCEEVMPKIDPDLLEQHPFLVVGNEPTPQVLRYGKSSPHVRVVGWVPSVVPYLQYARVTVVPMRFGAGTKRKLIQALMAHTPTVSTSIGTEGLNVVPGRHVLLADDPAEFAQATESLLRDRKLWEKLAFGGSEQIAKLHGKEVVQARLSEALDAILRKPFARATRRSWVEAARKDPLRPATSRAR